MTQPRKSELTRQTILTTGRRLVIQGGFGAMGLSALLKESGVPKGSFYYYFPSKEAFGQALLEDYVGDYLARIDALLAGTGTGADKFGAFCAAWLTHEQQPGLANTCLVVKLGAEVADLSDAMRQVLDQGVKALTGKLAQMLREGVADGSLSPQTAPEDTAQAIYAQLLGAAILAKLSQDQTPLETVLTDINTRLLPGAE
ncbi:MAG: TetR/AcrR family transcriptional regulator [Maritimibacter sp.]|jgi:TetR/AcrR family transcriptional regulator, transcriptional repressor for nem operon